MEKSLLNPKNLITLFLGYTSDKYFKKLEAYEIVYGKLGEAVFARKYIITEIMNEERYKFCDEELFEDNIPLENLLKFVSFRELVRFSKEVVRKQDAGLEIDYFFADKLIATETRSKDGETIFIKYF